MKPIIFPGLVLGSALYLAAHYSGPVEQQLQNWKQSALESVAAVPDVRLAASENEENEVAQGQSQPPRLIAGPENQPRQVPAPVEEWKQESQPVPGSQWEEAVASTEEFARDDRRDGALEAVEPEASSFMSAKERGDALMALSERMALKAAGY